MTRQSRGPAYALSVLVAALMALQAASGLVAPTLYRDVAWVKAAWTGNDVVTLAVAVPLLAGALLLTRRGSVRAELIWFSMLGYAVYNYAYYLFGARMNVLFPLYVALLVMAVFALILALSSYDATALARAFTARAPVRIVAAYMLITGTGLTVAWLAQWAGLVFGGVEPAIGEDAFSLIASLDLALIVPYFLVGAVLLWRRIPWGYLLGIVMCLKGATYTLVLTTASIVSAMRGLAGSAEQVPVWGAWTLVGAAASLALLRGLRPAD